MKRRDADPELRRLLETADAGQGVSVICALRPGSASPPEPGETQRHVTALMRRVEEQTGERPDEYTVFDNLGAFALTAPAEFVDRLLVQPEIATATANDQEEDLLIRPVERGPEAGPKARRTGEPSRSGPLPDSSNEPGSPSTASDPRPPRRRRRPNGPGGPGRP